MIISTYVDDVKFIFNNICIMDKVKHILENEFILEDRTHHNFYLGSTTIQDDTGIYVHSDTLIQKMVTQYKLEHIKEQDTPTVGNRKFSRAAMTPLEDKPIGKQQINYYKQFRSILGIIIYCITNPTRHYVCGNTNYKTTKKSKIRRLRRFNAYSRIFKINIYIRNQIYR